MMARGLPQKLREIERVLAPLSSLGRCTQITSPAMEAGDAKAIAGSTQLRRNLLS